MRQHTNRVRQAKTDPRLRRTPMPISALRECQRPAAVGIRTCCRPRPLYGKRSRWVRQAVFINKFNVFWCSDVRNRLNELSSGMIFRWPRFMILHLVGAEHEFLVINDFPWTFTDYFFFYCKFLGWDELWVRRTRGPASITDPGSVLPDHVRPFRYVKTWWTLDLLFNNGQINWWEKYK